MDIDMAMTACTYLYRNQRLSKREREVRISGIEVVSSIVGEKEKATDLMRWPIRGSGKGERERDRINLGRKSI